MANLDDDVDFQKLANEVAKTLAKDEKYQRENDAKFRAIHQKVKSYDEFRDIVEASHLRPLAKDDKIGGVSYQKWNQLANSNIETSRNEAKTVSSPHYIAQPANSSEFTRYWKRSCVTSEDKCNYLLSVDLELLKKCLQSDCMLGEIVSVLESNIEMHRQQIDEILGIFDIISTTTRFTLALDFLSDDEAKKLQNIFATLKPLSLENNDLFKKLCDSYKIKY